MFSYAKTGGRESKDFPGGPESDLAAPEGSRSFKMRPRELQESSKSAPRGFLRRFQRRCCASAPSLDPLRTTKLCLGISKIIEIH